MKLYLLYERKHKQDPHFFDYGNLAKEEWRELLRDAQEEQGISFDTENDDATAQRAITLDQQKGAVSKPRFNCEMRRAGGDWQVPVVYFRCQLKQGWARGLSQYGPRGPFFIFIPSRADGNTLVKTSKVGDGKGKWSAADNQGSRKSEIQKPDERSCWAALKKHLQDLSRKWREGIKESTNRTPSGHPFGRFSLRLPGASQEDLYSYASKLSDEHGAAMAGLLTGREPESPDAANLARWLVREGTPQFSFMDPRRLDDTEWEYNPFLAEQLGIQESRVGDAFSTAIRAGGALMRMRGNDFAYTGGHGRGVNHWWRYKLADSAAEGREPGRLVWAEHANPPIASADMAMAMIVAYGQYLGLIGRRGHPAAGWRARFGDLKESFWTLAPEAGRGDYPNATIKSIPKATDTGEGKPRRHSMLLHPSDRERFMGWGRK